jgi:hypothetical protein
VVKHEAMSHQAVDKEMTPCQESQGQGNEGNDMTPVWQLDDPSTRVNVGLLRNLVQYDATPGLHLEMLTPASLTDQGLELETVEPNTPAIETVSYGQAHVSPPRQLLQP